MSPPSPPPSLLITKDAAAGRRLGKVLESAIFNLLDGHFFFQDIEVLHQENRMNAFTFVTTIYLLILFSYFLLLSLTFSHFSLFLSFSLSLFLSLSLSLSTLSYSFCYLLLNNRRQMYTTLRRCRQMTMARTSACMSTSLCLRFSLSRSSF